ncbi:MAG: hypothetical protein U0W24_09490 [Bacteroidales bacterium]
MKRIFFTFLIACYLTNISNAQVFSNKEAGKKNEVIADSLKVVEYPYILPIWGEKVTQKGFQLPYSAGLSMNYFVQESDIIIEDLMVGFNNGPMYDLEEIIRFKSAVSTASSLSIRPDFWILPFLNVYAIFGKGKSSTSIDAGVWLPDTSNVWQEITSISSVANFDVTTAGFGFTPTVGVAGGFMAFDMNMAWTDVSALDKPVFSFVFGPRFGKSFKMKKKDRNIAVWVGGFRIHMSSETNGSLNLNEVLPVDEMQAKVDEGLAKVEDAQASVEEWWNGLSSTEQQNPINKAKYETANRTIDAAAGLLNTVDGALNDDQYATVQYSLTKRPKNMWNFIVGSQFQLNKHLMFRAEYGFLGTRQQFNCGIQYRFGL